MLSLPQVVAATAISAVITFATRLFPFVFFSRRKPTAGMAYIQRYLPPMTMVILVIYCLREISWTTPPFGLPAISGVLVTAVLHFWRGNALISIFSGTAIYMILMRLL